MILSCSCPMLQAHIIFTCSLQKIQPFCNLEHFESGENKKVLYLLGPQHYHWRNGTIALQQLAQPSPKGSSPELCVEELVFATWSRTIQTLSEVVTIWGLAFEWYQYLTYLKYLWWCQTEMPDCVLIQEDSIMTGARVKRQGSWFFVSFFCCCCCFP